MMCNDTYNVISCIDAPASRADSCISHVLLCWYTNTAVERRGSSTFSMIITGTIDTYKKKCCSKYYLLMDLTEQFVQVLYILASYF